MNSGLVKKSSSDKFSLYKCSLRQGGVLLRFTLCIKLLLFSNDLKSLARKIKMQSKIKLRLVWKTVKKKTVQYDRLLGILKINKCEALAETPFASKQAFMRDGVRTQNGCGPEPCPNDKGSADWLMIRSFKNVSAGFRIVNKSEKNCNWVNVSSITSIKKLLVDLNH